MTRLVTDGDSSESPAAMVGMAPISSSGRVRLSRNPEPPARSAPNTIARAARFEVATGVGLAPVSPTKPLVG
jgi:hypothetical protein